MRVVLGGKGAEVAIVIKQDACAAHSIKQHYTAPLQSLGVTNKFMAIGAYNTNKCKKAAVVADCKEILKKLDFFGVTTIICADSTYIKALTKAKTASAARFNKLACCIEGYEHITVLAQINYNAVEYNSQNRDILNTLNEYIALELTGGEEKKSELVIKYPKTEFDIFKLLKEYSSEKMLAIDIETTGLSPYTDSILTIGIAKSVTEGFSFCYSDNLKEAFKRFLKGKFKIIFHNASFDLTKLIVDLFLQDFDPISIKNALYEFDDRIHDSMSVAHIALNSTETISYSLKTLALPYMGDYAVDVKDTSKIAISDLLTYNAKDAIATYWVFQKYYAELEKAGDSLVNFYNTFSRPSNVLAIRIMLAGIPIDVDKLKPLKKDLVFAQKRLVNKLMSKEPVKKTVFSLAEQKWTKRKSELKQKIPKLNDFVEPFNPNSSQQLTELLYNNLKLPVINTTNNGNPATDNKTLKRLKFGLTDQEKLHTLDLILENSAISTLLSTFIPAFHKYSFEHSNGTYYIHGSINIDGTQSFRMSSANPNLMNFPSGSKYGKDVKSCLVAPSDDWLVATADFGQLEARIEAILTNDPNKIKIYEDGFDSHSLNTYSYFPSEFPDIDPDNPEQINSIAESHSKLRTESKPISFALQYSGTPYTIYQNTGFSREKSEEIYERYWDLYEVSKHFIALHTDKAIEQGYVDLAFGARLHTPLLHDSVRTYLSHLAEKEARSAVNAKSQSYGLLLNRACIATIAKLDRAKQYIQESVIINNVIHDAAYFLIRKDPVVVKWLNDNLIPEMQWNDYPPIKSEKVPMEAQLEISDKSLSDLVTIPNNASLEDIQAILNEMEPSHESKKKVSKEL